MASGYEARAGGRNSFASEGIDPVQTSSGASGASSSAQVVGGEAIAGTAGGQYSQPGYVAAGLGAYFEKFMEPTIARKERAQFFKGFTEAQSGRALDELSDSGSPLTKIFGASGFQQGAAYFHGRDRVNKWATAQFADMDNLKQMAPEELAKHMAQSSQELMTGDPYADDLIQQSVLEAQGPLIQTVAKNRYAWQQNEAKTAWSNAGRSSAGNLQTVAVEQGKLGDKADPEALKLAGGSFLRSMAKPEGMDDETYKDGLWDFLMGNMADGNFYGVNLLKRAGVLDLFDDDKRGKFDDAYQKYGKRAQAAAMQDPANMAELLAIDARIGKAKMYGNEADAASVVDVVGGYQGLNSRIKNMTGVDIDYFDAETVAGKGGEVIDAITARYNHDFTRAEAIDDRNFNAQATADAKKSETEDQLAQVRVAWGTGQIKAAVAGGMPSSHFETVAMEDYSQGNFGGIANAYMQSGWKSEGVSSMLQAQARASIGDKYTKSTEDSYQVWKKFHQLNPALSKEYFGEYDLAFTNFDRIVTGGGSREVAYQDSFTRRAYSVQEIPPAKRKDAEAALTTQINSTGFNYSSPSTWGNTTLNGPGKAELGRVLRDDYARMAETSPRPPDELAETAYQNAVRSGRFEKYGPLGWSNATTTQPLGEWLGLRPKEASEVITAAAKERLAAVQVYSLDDVRPIRTSVGLTLEYRKDGFPHYITITYGQLKGFTDARVKAGLTKRQTQQTGDAAKAMNGPLPFSL